MADTDWSQLASDLTETLHLGAPPLAITFSDVPPDGVAPFDEAMPEPLADGRTGRVPAGCVFWMKAAERTFSTVAEDHGNCSVGSVTHGFKALADVAGNSDVAALLDSGWVTMEVVPQIPVVREQYDFPVPLLFPGEQHDAVAGRANGSSFRAGQVDPLMVIPITVPKAGDQHPGGGPCEQLAARGRIERTSTRARDGRG